MAFKFKQGDPVFHKGAPGYTTIEGLYTVQQVGTDGMIYRVVDSNLDFTDADETELEHVTYAVFVRTPEGWPIIVPVFMDDLYKRFLNSNRYRFVLEGTASIAMEEMAQLMIKFEEEQRESTD